MRHFRKSKLGGAKCRRNVNGRRRNNISFHAVLLAAACFGEMRPRVSKLTYAKP